MPRRPSLWLFVLISCAGMLQTASNARYRCATLSAFRIHIHGRAYRTRAAALCKAVRPLVSIALSRRRWLQVLVLDIPARACCRQRFMLFTGAPYRTRSGYVSMGGRTALALQLYAKLRSSMSRSHLLGFVLDIPTQASCRLQARLHRGAPHCMHSEQISMGGHTTLALQLYAKLRSLP